MVGMSYAQTAACTRLLINAEEAFDQGRLLDVKELLLESGNEKVRCFNDFSKEEKIRAEKLLTKVHLFTDNIPEAEKSLVDLLLEDKEHQLAKDDPSELHFLYSKFQTEPIFRLGLRLAVNKSLPVVLQEFNTTDFPKNYNESATNAPTLGIGVSFEALLEKHIKNGIEVAVGPQYRIASYGVEGSFLQQSDQLYYNIRNQSQMLRIPVLGRYNFNYDKKNIEGIRLSKMFYVFAGASFDLTLNAQYVSTDRTGGTAFTLNENNSLTDFDQVSDNNISIFGGAGVKLRMGREQVHFLTFEVRYDNSLFNYVKPENRYANLDLFTNIGFVEDDLALNTVSISFGYTRSFYNPVKRKQYR